MLLVYIWWFIFVQSWILFQPFDAICFEFCYFFCVSIIIGMWCWILFYSCV